MALWHWQWLPPAVAAQLLSVTVALAVPLAVYYYWQCTQTRSHHRYMHWHGHMSPLSRSRVMIQDGCPDLALSAPTRTVHRFTVAASGFSDCDSALVSDRPDLMIRRSED